jgi:hypothetical protein
MPLYTNRAVAIRVGEVCVTQEWATVLRLAGTDVPVSVEPAPERTATAHVPVLVTGTRVYAPASDSVVEL